MTVLGHVHNEAIVLDQPLCAISRVIPSDDHSLARITRNPGDVIVANRCRT